MHAIPCEPRQRSGPQPAQPPPTAPPSYPHPAMSRAALAPPPPPSEGPRAPQHMPQGSLMQALYAMAPSQQLSVMSSLQRSDLGAGAFAFDPQGLHGIGAAMGSAAQGGYGQVVAHHGAGALHAAAMAQPSPPQGRYSFSEGLRPTYSPDATGAGLACMRQDLMRGNQCCKGMLQPSRGTSRGFQWSQGARRLN